MDMATQQPPPIRNFNELIEPYLNGAKVLTNKIRFLTKPGDNYGSTMLGVTVFLERPDRSTSEMEVVAKCPPQNELFWKLFQPEISFRTENNCYTVIAPALLRIQEEAKIPKEMICDVFAKCYGARVSLNGDSKVDSDAALLLENLVVQGYKVGDRIKGFDYEHIIVILRDLAEFQATVIALRNLKPKEFEQKFRPHLKRFNIEAGFDEEVGKGVQECTINDVKSVTKDCKEIWSELPKRFEAYNKYMENNKPTTDSIFTTLAHFDFWVNNMLINYDPNGKPKNIKIVDYQVAQYDSLAHDLVFFLFTCVPSELLIEKFDFFLKFYYENFLDRLQLIGASVNDYTFEKFIEEINWVARLQFAHIIIMLKVLFIKTEQISDFKDINEDTFMSNAEVDDRYFEQMRAVIKLYRQKGWL